MTDYPAHGLTPQTLAAYKPLDPQLPGIDKAIDAAVEDLRRRAGWHIFPVVDEILTVDGEGGTVLTLPTLRMTEVLQITENGRILDPDTDYEWSASGDVKRLRDGYLGRSSWTTRWRGIQAHITHGYDSPPDLLNAIATVVATAAASPLGLPEVMGPFQFTGGGSHWAGDAGETVGRYSLPWSA